MDDFESGAIDDRQAIGSGSGAWFVYSDGQEAPDPDQSDPTLLSTSPIRRRGSTRR